MIVGEKIVGVFTGATGLATIAINLVSVAGLYYGVYVMNGAYMYM